MDATRTPPQLTPIAIPGQQVTGVGHDGSDLWVRFNGDALYRYEGAGPEHVEAMAAADSPRRYFTDHIRGRFTYEKVVG